jgi:hypothetical protein
MPHWEASLQCEDFNTKELVGKRCIVPVYPGGTRDTIIADISANNSIRWLERALRHVLEHVPESAVSLYSHTFQSRLEDVVYQEGYHVLRDIKKCGITYNTHDLFPIVKEELRKRIPDIRWKRMDIYSRLIIVDDDTEFVAQRGYGLGMANHLVTLCNIVIHRMARGVLDINSDHSFKMKAICGNDDEDVVIYGSRHARQLAQDYMEIEHDIHGALGNLINIKKSVVKPYGLFYETYNKPGWEDKEALVCNALACAYLAPSIRVAKHYISSQSTRFNSPWARSQLRHLAAYWGDEFFNTSTELKIHYEIGGWLDTRSLGLKTTLRDIERLHEKFPMDHIGFAAETCRQFMKPPSPCWKTKEMVSNHMYLGKSCRSDPEIQMYTLGEQDLRWYYKRLTKYQRNYSSRLSKYESRVKEKSIAKDVPTLIRKFLRRNPWYSIPEGFAEEQFPDRDHKIGYKSELTLHGEDITDNKLKKLMGLPHELFEEDNNTLWNPPVPTEVTKLSIEVDIATQLWASQYSNSGFLPILEYWFRHGAYPKCTPYMGRTRFFALPREVESHPLKLSRHKVVVEKQEEVRVPGIAQPMNDDPDTWGDVLASQPRLEGSAQELEDFISQSRELYFQLTGARIEDRKEEVKEPEPPAPYEMGQADMATLDSLIGSLQGGDLAVMNLLGPVESTSILDEQGDDEEGGFGFFGDEEW